MDVPMDLAQYGQRVFGRDEPVSRDEAFAALVERQGRFLYRVAFSVMRNTHDAEDAVQEALLKLYRTGAWQTMEDEKAYLARVVWRIAVKHLPRMSWQKIADSNEMKTLPAAGDSPETAAMRSAEESRLRRLIEELPEELRLPLRLSAIEEMNSREVGLVMGIPEGTVRTRLMRARAELRRRFEAMEVRR